MAKRRRKLPKEEVKSSLEIESIMANFANDLLNEINLFRSNPKQYSEKIRSHMAYIKPEKDKIIYDNGDTKIFLLKGQEAFNQCNQILLNTSPLNQLELSEDIKIEVPDDPELQIKSYNKLQALIKSNFPENKISSSIDLGAPNPEAIVVLQLVDDNKNNGIRRTNLLDNSFLHLGVSIKKGKSKNCTIYLTFSD